MNSIFKGATADREQCLGYEWEVGGARPWGSESWKSVSNRQCALTLGAPQCLWGNVQTPHLDIGSPKAWALPASWASLPPTQTSP